MPGRKSLVKIQYEKLLAATENMTEAERDKTLDAFIGKSLVALWPEMYSCIRRGFRSRATAGERSVSMQYYFRMIDDRRARLAAAGGRAVLPFPTSVQPTLRKGVREPMPEIPMPPRELGTEEEGRDAIEGTARVIDIPLSLPEPPDARAAV